MFVQAHGHSNRVQHEQPAHQQGETRVRNGNLWLTARDKRGRTSYGREGPTPRLLASAVLESAVQPEAACAGGELIIPILARFLRLGRWSC